MAVPEELEENKRIVREFIETAFNQHEADKAAALLTPDPRINGERAGGSTRRSGAEPGRIGEVGLAAGAGQAAGSRVTL